jgi:hypothetical protein
MTSADFCPITPWIAPWRDLSAWLLAALFARRGRQHFPCAQACFTSGLTGHLLHHATQVHAGQISPDKNVNCGYTTAAFTLSPEPEGFVVLCQLARRLSLVCRFCSSARSFALRLPSDPASQRRPCHRLVLMLMISTINRILVQGTFTP